MMKRERQINTELLVIRFQQGEKEALRLIVELWQQSLVSFAFRYLGREPDAWDAVQETWVSVLKGLNKVRAPSMFTSWLFRTLTNKCIDRIRQLKADKRHAEQPRIIAVARDEYDDEPLHKAVDRLSEQQKVLLALRFGQGLQLAEIAAVMNVLEGTVRTRLHRALTQLRQTLGVKP
jgi:RNA polymerase sigma factor (sigma-70 family)